jgi:hypothetical protein
MDFIHRTAEGEILESCNDSKKKLSFYNRYKMVAGPGEILVGPVQVYEETQHQDCIEACG